jgi:hypothetical protein
MLYAPAFSVEVERVATPLLRMELPIEVVPFMKLTVPVGVPGVPEVTVAVNATLWLKFARARPELNAVFVGDACTNWATASEVLAEKSTFPP